MSRWKDGKANPQNDVKQDLQESNGTLRSSTDSFHSAEDIDNSCLGRLKRILKRIYKVSSSLVGLIIILICYSFLGAWIFWSIESRHEQTYKHDISYSRNAIILELMATSMTSHVRTTTEEQLKQLLVDYEADIMKAYKAGVTSASTEEVWGFWDSLVFCGTVYSTIGRFLEIFPKLLRLYHRLNPHTFKVHTLNGLIRSKQLLVQYNNITLNYM